MFVASSKLEWLSSVPVTEEDFSSPSGGNYLRAVISNIFQHPSSLAATSCLSFIIDTKCLIPAFISGSFSTPSKSATIVLSVPVSFCHFSSYLFWHRCAMFTKQGKINEDKLCILSFFFCLKVIKQVLQLLSEPLVMFLSIFRFEKYISGKYMGEIVRVIVADFAKSNLLFNGNISEKLKEVNTFTTANVSNIEEWVLSCL